MTKKKNSLRATTSIIYAVSSLRCCYLFLWYFTSNHFILYIYLPKTFDCWFVGLVHRLKDKNNWLQSAENNSLVSFLTLAHFFHFYILVTSLVHIKQTAKCIIHSTTKNNQNKTNQQTFVNSILLCMKLICNLLSIHLSKNRTEKKRKERKKRKFIALHAVLNLPKHVYRWDVKIRMFFADPSCVIYPVFTIAEKRCMFAQKLLLSIWIGRKHMYIYISSMHM